MFYAPWIILFSQLLDKFTSIYQLNKLFFIRVLRFQWKYSLTKQNNTERSLTKKAEDENKKTRS